MASPGRKWVLNHGKIWKKMSKQISVKIWNCIKKTARRTLMSMRYNRIISYGRGALSKLIEKSTEVKFNESNAC